MPDPRSPSDSSRPSLPPTPPVELSALLARTDLALRPLAGPEEAVLYSAHASEMTDPYPYLLGGELLLTAGLHIPPEATADDRSPYFDTYVSRITAAGGAALGFGVTPVHDTVPEALVAACARHRLPLVEVPPHTTFAAVARAVWQLMAQARLAELRRVTEAVQSLAAAASRPGPVPSVLRRLARHVDGRAVLYGPDGTRITEEGRAQHPPAVREALDALARTVTGRARSSATDTVAGLHLSAYALGAGEGLVLAVASAHRAAGDHTVASVAVVLLSLLTGGHHGGTGPALTSALVRLLLGAGPEKVAPLLGADRWVVVHARPAVRAADEVAASALGAALGSPLTDLADGVVRVLVPAGREVSAVPGWTLGVSSPVGPRDWPAADAQASAALARALATRTPLVTHGGLGHGLTGLVPADRAAAHARALLSPLTPALTETLRTWLSLHGGWDRTAAALGLHRNTVRQRIARCAALLKADLDDPDVRMELWFALRHV